MFGCQAVLSQIPHYWNTEFCEQSGPVSQLFSKYNNGCLKFEFSLWRFLRCRSTFELEQTNNALYINGRALAVGLGHSPLIPGVDLGPFCALPLDNKLAKSVIFRRVFNSLFFNQYHTAKSHSILSRHSLMSFEYNLSADPVGRTV